MDEITEGFFIASYRQTGVPRMMKYYIRDMDVPVRVQSIWVFEDYKLIPVLYSFILCESLKTFSSLNIHSSVPVLW